MAKGPDEADGLQREAFPASKANEWRQLQMAMGTTKSGTEWGRGREQWESGSGTL